MDDDNELSVFQRDHGRITRVRIGDTVYNLTEAFDKSDIMAYCPYGPLYNTVACEIYNCLRGHELKYGFVGEYLSEPNHYFYFNEMLRIGCIGVSRIETKRERGHTYETKYYKFVKPPFSNWVEILNNDRFDSSELRSRRLNEFKVYRDR